MRTAHKTTYIRDESSSILIMTIALIAHAISAIACLPDAQCCKMRARREWTRMKHCDARCQSHQLIFGDDNIVG